MDINTQYDPTRLQALIDQKTPKESSKIIGAFKVAIGLACFAAIASGIMYRIRKDLIAGGSAGLAALTIFHCCFGHKKPGIKYPDVLMQVGKDESDQHANIIRIWILGEGTDLEKFNKIKAYLQEQPQLELLCRRDQFVLRRQLMDILSAFSPLVSDPSLQKKIKELYAWVDAPVVDWQTQVDREKIPPHVLERIPSTALVAIREKAEVDDENAPKLLKSIAVQQARQQQARQWLPEFNHHDGFQLVHGVKNEPTYSGVQLDASQNGYCQLGLFHFNKGNREAAMRMFTASINATGLTDPKVIIALKAANGEDREQFDIWKTELLFVGLQKYQGDASIAPNWIRGMNKGCITNPEAILFLGTVYFNVGIQSEGVELIKKAVAEGQKISFLLKEKLLDYCDEAGNRQDRDFFADPQHFLPKPLVKRTYT